MRPTQKVLWARVASLSLLAFLLIGSYAIARSSIDSLFLAHFSSQRLPYAWLATAFFTAIAMLVYNRYSLHHSLLKLFGIGCVISSALLLGLLKLQAQGLAYSVVLLFIWKEIYVVVLVEIFWSFADVVFSIKNARWIYGILLGAGSFGGLLGSYFIGHFAQAIGTEQVIWWVLPLLMLCWLISVLFAKSAGDVVPHHAQKTTSKWFESILVVQKSRYLVPLLFLVAVIQIATTLIDYEFNSTLQREFTDIDARTNIMGKTHAVVDFLAVALQFFTGPILRLVGVGSTLLAIPVFIALSVTSFLAFPQLATILITKISSKCFDYSLFRAAKEILYIPLSRAEKTQGKALIDILIYRISKGASSLLILAMIAFGSSHWNMQITLAFLLLWIFLTYIIVRRYQSIVTLEQEYAGEMGCKAENDPL